MRKFIVIICMLLLSVNSFAQFSRTPNKADEREIAEWKTAMKQITNGKTMVWASLAVAGVGTSAGLIATSSLTNKINNGEFGYQLIDSNGNLVNDYSYSSTIKTINTAIIVTDVVCLGVAIGGLIMQKQGRKKADRIYFGSGGLTYSF